MSVSTDTLRSISTPERIDSRLGPLDFLDGFPSRETKTTEGRGWFPILRLYSPLQSFFDKSWRPSEIEGGDLDKPDTFDPSNERKE